ncbi:YicC/YloC family endoribonuclease [Massilia sp. ST3]|uniref:YicC/YloC family endoribonuclease n=1 Tax=Massilia sp. ST3 TaxID=2824903 RepID=UPI001B8102A6|nr:YicC/YloC family endoribonuclease [Massilia sp. ST3]MBQ5946382.1 YicC family protein [Massilia sp. ST3]
MTGYAVATSEGAAGTLTIEIKSVNSRFLDLQFRINDDLRALEPELRAAIMAAITRGKVEVRLSFGRKASGGSQALNQELLNDLARLQAEVTRHFASAPQMTVAELLRWPGVIEESTIGQESLQADVAALTKTTIAAFVESRKREGAALDAMLQSRIDAMEAIVKRITPLIPQVIAQFQQKAIERMQDALGLAGHGNPTTLTRQEVLERIRQEVTLYGIRIDVSEELSRLSAHLNETRHILKKGGQVGKRLDFMMQELNREANTLGAKASVKELADASMELKLLIEQMREQVQNLE